MADAVPTGEPLSEAVLADQLGTYDRMRSSCPVAASPSATIRTGRYPLFDRDSESAATATRKSAAS